VGRNQCGWNMQRVQLRKAFNNDFPCMGFLIFRDFALDQYVHARHHSRARNAHCIIPLHFFARPCFIE